MTDPICDKMILEKIYNHRIIDKDNHWLYKTQNKRPMIEYDGKYWNLSRLILKLTKIDFDDDLWALHKCDNEQCWNPEHLYQGTRKDNEKDAFANGKRNQHAKKLTCPLGHTYTKRPDGRGRYCKQCNHKGRKEANARKNNNRIHT